MKSSLKTPGSQSSVDHTASGGPDCQENCSWLSDTDSSHPARLFRKKHVPCYIPGGEMGSEFESTQDGGVELPSRTAARCPLATTDYGRFPQE